jgi:uncharacterized protein
VALTPAIVAGVAAFGLLVGGLSALLGAGGGLIMVPFLALAVDLGQHAAEGTSLLVIVPTAAVGVFAHSRAGFVDFRSAALVGLGGAVGSLAGAALALEVSGELLETIFGAFVIVAGGRRIYQGMRAGR